MPPHASPDALFGCRVDVVVHGGTHVAEVINKGPTLFVNPGSPTLADRVSVAIIELAGGDPRASVLYL